MKIDSDDWLFIPSVSCSSSSETAEVVIRDSNSKVYRLDLSRTTSTSPMVCSELGFLINGIRNGLYDKLVWFMADCFPFIG